MSKNKKLDIRKPDAFNRIYVFSEEELILEYRPNHYLSYNCDAMAGEGIECKNSQFIHALECLAILYNKQEHLSYSNSQPSVAIYKQLNSYFNKLKIKHSIHRYDSDFESDFQNYIYSKKLLFSKTGAGCIIATNYTSRHVFQQ